MRCRRCKADSAVPEGKLTCIVCGAVQFGSPQTPEGTSSGEETYGIIPLSDVAENDVPRLVTGLGDLLWGYPGKEGVAKPSVTLFGGCPGFGKTTFLLQWLSRVAKASGKKALLIQAEEGASQIKGHATRLQLDNLNDILILPLEAQARGVQLTEAAIAHFDPAAVVIDSTQKYAPTPEQACELAESVKGTATIRNCPFVIVCQINKAEEFEGSMRVQHAADTLIMGDKLDVIETDDGQDVEPPEDAQREWRRLRAIKNRFAPESEHYFYMNGLGLQPYEL